MIRPIALDPDQYYDHLDYGRIEEVGLYERLTVRIQMADGETHDVNISDATFEALRNDLEVGVNVAPGEKTFTLVGVSYVYDYGNGEHWSDADLETMRNIRDEALAPTHP